MQARSALVVPVPGSKSEAIRAFIGAALRPGTRRVVGAPDSGDVRAVVGALRALGVPVSKGGVVRGGPLPPGERRLYLGGSATGLRMLACVAALREGRTILDGDRSLRRRIRLPLVVEGGATSGGIVEVDASTTSQVASGLLLAGFRIRVKGRAVSRPYLALTRQVIRRLKRSRRLQVEPDWSSAAYAFLRAAILGETVRVPGLNPRSLQADRAVVGLLRKAGARWRGLACTGGPLRPFKVDLRDSPDLAPTAAVLALFAEGESRVTGAAHLRAKESDRIASCVAAVKSLGGRARATRDGFVVRGGTPRPGVVDPRGDHRIALAFGVAALAIPGTRILDRACVAKSWPGAWRSPLFLARRARGG